MKRIRRDPLKFDIFTSFALHGREEKVSLRSPEAAEGFVARVRTSVERSLASEAFLYGLRTQIMFGALVASLGRMQILKEEDVGEIYVSDEALNVPDYCLVLGDGCRTLVEVKNFYGKKDPFNPFVLAEHYIGGLIRYSDLMGCSLKFAVYWSNWNQWTLVSPSVFERKGGFGVLSFGDAMRFNEMSVLGDAHVGTRFPLRMRIVTDKTKPRSIDSDGNATCWISGIELYCAERQITDPLEQNIAVYLMCYGKWRSDGGKAEIVGGQLEAVEEQCVPEEDHGQGFEIIGSLSSMFSNFYRQATSDEGRLEQLQADISPGSLGRLIPEDYKGDALPLWIFVLKASELNAAT